MKRNVVILYIFLFLCLSMVKADDRKDFYHQIEGWEWVYQEPCKSVSISYPTQINFYSYDLHPEFRIINEEMNPYGDLDKSVTRIYDRDGKLVRVACLLSENTVDLTLYKSFINDRIESYKKQWTVLYYSCMKEAIDCMGTIQSSKDYVFYGLNGTNYEEQLKKSANINDQSDYTIYKGNPFPRKLEIYLGEIYSHKKWNNKRQTAFLKMIQNASIAPPYIKLHAEFTEPSIGMIAPGYKIYATIDENYLKSRTDRICEQATPNGNYKFTEFGRFKPIIGDVNEKLLNMMMVEDYYNNKYNILDRESIETLNIIEEKLGLKEPQEVDELEVTLEFVCEILRVKYHQGITRNEVAAQLQEKYPYKDDMNIQEMIVNAFTEATSLRLLALRGEQQEKEKRERNARYYLEQLKRDHWNDNEITTIERISDTSFKLTFNTKTSKSKFYAYVWFYSDEPYSYKTKIEIKADWNLNIKGK